MRGVPWGHHSGTPPVLGNVDTAGARERGRISEDTGRPCVATFQRGQVPGTPSGVQTRSLRPVLTARGQKPETASVPRERPGQSQRHLKALRLFSYSGHRAASSEGDRGPL